MSAPRAFLFAPPYGAPKMEPLGLIYLATVARQHGFEVDLAYESYRTRFTVEEMTARALAQHYDVVGATAMTPTLPRSLEVFRAVKQARPETVTVLGGYHATVAHTRLLARSPEVDVAVRGEGEETFLEMMQRLAAGATLDGVGGVTFRGPDGIVVNPDRALLRELDELPFPDRDLGPGPDEYLHTYVDFEGAQKPRANVMSSRGCPYGCSFCVLGSSDPKSPISMRKWRLRTPDNVLDEIEQLIEQRGIGGVIFAEDNFTVSPRRLDEFARKVVERGLEFTFTFDSRANQICRLEAVMPALRRAGLRAVEVGVENASQPVLDRFAKGTLVEHNVNALRILRENDIEARVDFIMFEPYTTVDDLRTNRKFLAEAVAPDYDHGKTVYHKLELHPGTELQRQYLANGLIQGDPDEVIPYDFVHPEVSRIYAVMDDFYWNHQERLTALRERMHFLQVALTRAGRRDDKRRLAQDLVFLVRPMHRLPLRLFEAVLDGDHDAASLGRRVEPFIERVGALEKELDQLVVKHGLTTIDEGLVRGAVAIGA